MKTFICIYWGTLYFGLNKIEIYFFLCVCVKMVFIAVIFLSLKACKDPFVAFCTGKQSNYNKSISNEINLLSKMALIAFFIPLLHLYKSICRNQLTIEKIIEHFLMEDLFICFTRKSFMTEEVVSFSQSNTSVNKRNSTECSFHYFGNSHESKNIA